MKPTFHALHYVPSRCIERQVISTFRTRPLSSPNKSPRHYGIAPAMMACLRTFSTTTVIGAERSSTGPGRERKHDGSPGKKIGEAKELQTRTPWHREGADQPPVKRLRSKGTMKKGKLLTTPSRMLKLILPLATLDNNSDGKDIEPLALLVHPQQPLSYLERLIQSELPVIKTESGQEKVPQVYFRAEDSVQEEVESDTVDDELVDEEEGTDEHMVDGKLVKTGKINDEQAESLDVENKLRGGPGEGGVETYSGLGHEAPDDPGEVKFVRWSSSTEIGDFIRDAARGKEFAVEIEGAEKEIRVGVPSFNDRTHYLRLRLRKKARDLEDLTKIKKECDQLANRSAQRLAMGGFGILVSWWAAIYYFTFRTPYGWATMEPITYLAGLSTIMIGYLYFLWHNREVSYRAALHLTVSHRQSQLYASRGFDAQKWQNLIDEANALRAEVKNIANEYDVEWDETKDEVSETVHQALREERQKQKSKEDREDEGEEVRAKEKIEEKEEEKEEKEEKKEG